MSPMAAPPASKMPPKNYFKKEKFVLKIVGISFTGDESFAYRMYSFTFILLFNCIYTVLDIREVFVHSLDVVADMMMYVLVTMAETIKALVVLRNRIKVGKILDKLEQKPFIPNVERGGDIEQALIEECLWITNVQTLAYWICMYTTVIGNITFTIIKRIKSNNYLDWELPYGPFTVLNVTHSPNYEITWVFQNLSVTWIATHFCTIDVLAAGILAHISFQFKMLQNNFRRIVENSYRDMIKEKLRSSELKKDSNFYSDFDTSAISWKYLKKSLKEAVEYHLAIIDMANEMEGILTDLLLIIFLSALAVLGLTVYHASELSLSDNGMLVTIGEAMVNWMQVATICYWGNEVMIESQNLRNAVFEANFVGTDVRFQKGLALIIRKSQNPSKLTAGKFTDVCLSTFVWVMRASYSSFMLLRNTNAKKI